MPRRLRADERELRLLEEEVADLRESAALATSGMVRLREMAEEASTKGIAETLRAASHRQQPSHSHCGLGLLSANSGWRGSSPLSAPEPSRSGRQAGSL